MTVYHKHPTARSYGQAIGILLLDCRLPFVPGDVANATSYDYPVIYKLVEGLSTPLCLNGAPEFAETMCAAARELAAEGVRGISSDCGFMLQYQRDVADAVDIPVALSSLLQLPMIARSISATAPIGIITADDTNLDDAFLRRAGLNIEHPLVIRGMQNEAEFKSAILDAKGTLDTDLITEETVRVAREMKNEHPNLGAVLLECSLLPPYAKAVQDAIDVPVYDFISIIDQLQAGTHPHRYQDAM